MTNSYIFDIDGTITYPRKIIDADCLKAINILLNSRNMVYFVTGSDYKTAYSQCGDLCDRIDGVFSSSGNVLHHRHHQIFSNEWIPDDNIINWLETQWNSSTYPQKAQHGIINIRPGSLNFSVIGAGNLDADARQKYSEWDRVHNERQTITSAFKEKFQNLDASVGGQISIDIYPKGSDKSQILKYLSPILKQVSQYDGMIYFFGDKIQKGGNDFSLAQALKMTYNNAIIYETSEPSHTQKLIYELLGNT